jgi:hypothetical protein
MKDQDIQGNSNNQVFRGITVAELLFLLFIGLCFFLIYNQQRNQLKRESFDIQRTMSADLIQERLKRYILENDSFPTEEEFKSEEWRETNFNYSSSDENSYNIFKDPEDGSDIIYVPSPEGCGNSDLICFQATFGFVLSNQTSYLRVALKPGYESQALNEAINAEVNSAENTDIQSQEGLNN